MPPPPPSAVILLLFLALRDVEGFCQEVRRERGVTKLVLLCVLAAHGPSKLPGYVLHQHLRDGDLDA